MDEHTKGEEMSLKTDGAFMSEEEVKDLGQESTAVENPEPGTVAPPTSEHDHLHTMPEGEVHVINEDGSTLV
ncbi:MAG TPA: hypothetical protein VLA04_01795 [Verrucomicrobiae bacterium]|nr:hypothetical protein [Verrucomicrobiae bacterium]